MNGLIIEKQSFKFSVEISHKKDGLRIYIKRFVDVNNDENLALNAQFVKNEVLRDGEKFYNCNKLLKKTARLLADELKQDGHPCEVSIHLTKQHRFGV